MFLLKLLLAFAWAVTGAVSVRWYGKLYCECKEVRINPLTIYAGFSYIMAGIEFYRCWEG